MLFSLDFCAERSYAPSKMKKTIESMLITLVLVSPLAPHEEGNTDALPQRDPAVLPPDPDQHDVEVRSEPERMMRAYVSQSGVPSWASDLSPGWQRAGQYTEAIPI
jgi:hypothetical protein